jgi:hypothetical protein
VLVLLAGWVEMWLVQSKSLTRQVQSQDANRQCWFLVTLKTCADTCVALCSQEMEFLNIAPTLMTSLARFSSGQHAAKVGGPLLV